MVDLVTDAGLVTAVDEEGAGGERGGGALREGGLRGWSRWGGDGVEQVLGVGYLVLLRGCLWAQGGDGVRDLVRQGDLVVELVVAVGEGLEGSGGQGGDVAGEGVVGVGRVEFVALDEGGVDVLEAVGQLTSDQVLVETSLKIRHPGNLAGSGRAALSATGPTAAVGLATVVLYIV